MESLIFKGCENDVYYVNFDLYLENAKAMEKPFCYRLFSDFNRSQTFVTCMKNRSLRSITLSFSSRHWIV